jgi:cytochrome c oxidase subunit 2
MTVSGGDWPMTYLRTAGPRADPATALTWGLMDLSIAVVVIVTALVVAGVLIRRIHVPAGDIMPPAAAGPRGLAWIGIGLALTVVALAASLIWTVEVLAEINSPATHPALTLEVTGHQWWWEVRYLGQTPAGTFATANEIHIPTGVPVLVKLYGADVIHSFWVPALTGKTDTIPGRENVTWLQADRPGVYRGQCTEYCGVEHAKMALYVVAEPPADFSAWKAAQLAPASAPAGDAASGATVFQARCSACHTVRGSAAGGAVGPDLTHLATRKTIASGILPNTPEALEGWVSNPEALKPGSKMPATNLSGPQLLELTAYLESLK